MSEPKPFEAIVNNILDGTAAPQLRQAAARGALPLPRPALVRLYIALREDDDEAIRTDAQASLNGLDHASVVEVLRDETCAPEVLSHYSDSATKDEGLAEAIAFHRSVPSSALELLAGKGNSKVIDLVLTNQERLLVQPELLNQLSVNPALRNDQRGRIIELLERATRQRTKKEEEEAVDAPGDLSETEVSPEVVEAVASLELDIGELFAASEIMGGEEFEEAEDPEIRNAYKRILMLNPAQKAILAMRGGREERMILIRDTNKIVSMSVLKNGRITDEDVESISKLRAVSSDVLRQIGQTRDWVKNYTVVHALVHNPRTPPGTSTNFIPRLQNQDLKRLISNHDVPELIRRMAKRTLDIRTQKKSRIGKKK